VVDLNNLRQFGMANNLVASDSNDLMPWPNWLSGDLVTQAQGWLYTLDKAASGPARYQVQTGSFWSVLTSPKMYFCPTDNTNSTLFMMRGQQISSYVMNGAVCGFGRNLNPPAKLAQLSPAGVAFWECADNTEEDNKVLFNDGASDPRENTSVRHGKVAVYGAFDGSAKLMKLTEWVQKAQADGPNELWCFPGTTNGK